ncbi:MAG: PilT/PilU family type 4a pilus ATPase [Candidatus Omnitrophica bacterium]|nr:PilT/PilU family type 4a pilus ATPase [Candidatus Omnitrophota bacterium]
MNQQRRLIGEELIREGLISEEQLFTALDVQRLSEAWQKLGKVLLDLGYVSADVLNKFLKEKKYTEEDVSFVEAIPVSLAEEISITQYDNVRELLRMMVCQGASDLHLRVGVAPTLRINGIIKKTPLAPLNPETVQELLLQLISRETFEEFQGKKELDFSLSIPDLSRFRINVYLQRGTLSMAIRAIPYRIPTIEELTLPPIVKDIINVRGGLILITGANGMGKSTTLASLVGYLNQTKELNIITIEDPIEYIHKHQLSTIDQRELGKDTLSFEEALKHVVRQDPDVVMIGEMRDLETIRTALTLAETGHLILATLHTLDAVHAINRIVDVFPQNEKEQTRVQLSMALEAVICQQLLPAKDKNKRILATEILRATDSVRNLIRTNQLPQIYTIMQTSSQLGMHTMPQSLVTLYKKELIVKDELFKRCQNPDEIKALL